MNQIGSARLEFKPELNCLLGKDKQLRDGLSAIVQVGNTLWVANDERMTIERLTLQKQSKDHKYKYGDHKQFKLEEYFSFSISNDSPVLNDSTKKVPEADLEGLAYQDGYLWLVGSHSLVRGRPRQEDSSEDNRTCLTAVNPQSHRFLLGRIPLVAKGETYTLKKEVEQEGKKYTAARLRSEKGGNDLTKALAKDPHLSDFLHIPSKDNGFDIEGLAIASDRIFLGLRGPVLSGWAVILELELEEEDAFTLKLKQIGPDNQYYRKHFLQLNGLGIRDLCVLDNNLLILAGPTMMLDGPSFLFQWAGGAKPNQESMVFLKNSSERANEDELRRLKVKIPSGQEEGFDHPEGITLFSSNGRRNDSILVVYDSAAKARHKSGSAVKADIFTLD